MPKKTVLFFSKTLVLLLSLLTYSSSFNCGIDAIKPHPIKKLDLGTSKIRGLSSQFSPIRITVDEFQTVGSSPITEAFKSKTKQIISSTMEMFKSLINVIPLTQNLKMDVGEECGSAKASAAIIAGVPADLFLFPILDSTLPSNVDAAASFCYTDNSNRPVIGQVLINPRYNLAAANSEKFLQMLIFHEVTHVLVFHSALYQYYTDENGVEYKSNAITTTTINGVSRTKLATKKVIEAAREHYGCDTLDGVELENQGGDGSAGSHWESRIMLGDYMVSTDYPEMVISDITMALFEDSGWYTVNKYTGGLFRFGKNQGCGFLSSKCIKNSKSISVNDFCSVKDQKRCSSGRTNKGSCKLSSVSEGLPSEYQYFKDKKLGGFKPADYCPVAYESRDNDYYQFTSCKLGRKDYTVEQMGDNSMCVVSSIKEKNDKGMCLPIRCNDRTVTITIGSTDYECPREGGKVDNVSGYKGDLYCPDYNLVCTGSVWCNDPIDCINKKSQLKKAVYDYTPNPSQISGRYIYMHNVIFIFVLAMFIL